MSQEESTEKPSRETITVAGVTFSADQVVSATLNIDGRKIHICEQESPRQEIGFPR